MRRKPHDITPNKASQRPEHVLFFDTETSPVALSPKENQQVLKLGWACYLRNASGETRQWEKWVKFTDASVFWDFVEGYVKRKRKLYLVAHNIAFDFRVLGGFDYMEKNDWQLKFFYNKGQTCLLTYVKDKATIQLLDMTNFYPMSLRAVGESLGMEKQDIDFDTTDLESLSQYCKQDVKIMVAAWLTWLRFLDKHDLGNFQNTLPSQAFTAYRHRFMPYRISIHTNEQVCILEREAYRGGRSEVFWQGSRKGETYYQLDVNSMYSYVMVAEKYPTKLLGERYYMSIAKMKRMLKHSDMIAKVEIQTNEPLFPVRMDNRNVYPVGSFTTTLTTPELKYALSRGMVKKVKHVAWYRSRPLFTEYSTYFADLKTQYSRADDSAFRTIAKLFGNSLYGKFGQRGIKTTIRSDVPTRTPDFANIVEVDSVKDIPEKKRVKTIKGLQRKLTSHVFGRSYWLGKQYIVEEIDGESYHSFPAIAAHVTAYARMYLWSLMQTSGRINTFYCDTDCLIVNQAGYDNLKHLLDDHELGKLKVEKFGNNLTIYASKDYVLGDKTRTKGIRKNAKRVGENTYEQDQFLGLAGAISRGEPDLVTITRIRKRLAREIKTGTVTPGGWVTPFNFPL